jgi:hypothetical protein
MQRKSRLMVRSILVFAVLTLNALATPQSSALSLTNVLVSGNAIDPGKNELLRIQFALDEAADVAINWYDGREYRVHRQALGKMSAGEHDATWDGRDAAGKSLPAEAYHFVFEVSANNKTVLVDTTDSTAGKPVPEFTARWLPEKKALEYALPSPGRVRLRVGLDNNGPLMNTVLDWVPRGAGIHREPWDGKDASNVIDLGKHPKLVVVAEAFSLPANTVLVGKTEGQSTFVTLDKPVRRAKTADYRKQMFDFSQQVLQQLGDFPLELHVAGASKSGAVPVVSGVVRLVLDVNDRHMARISGTRFEPVLYLDGQFLFENEVGFLPLAYNWDTRAVNEGEHYITANVRGYEGNFGIATMKLIVRHPAGKETR